MGTVTSKINFSKLKLKSSNEYTEVKLEDGNVIKVLKFLPSNLKLDFIDYVIQRALDDSDYIPIKLDIYFNLAIVYMYTNIVFTEKQKEDELKLFDLLDNNGIIYKVIQAMPESEYNVLFDNVTKISQFMIEENRSINNLVKTFINNLPKDAKAAAEIIDNFDKEKYQEVINFANSVMATTEKK